MIKKVALFTLLFLLGFILNACKQKPNQEDVIKEFAYYRIEYTHHDRAAWLSRSVLKLSGEIWIFDTDQYIDFNGYSSAAVYYETKQETLRFWIIENGKLRRSDILLIKVTKELRDVLYVYPFEVIYYTRQN